MEPRSEPTLTCGQCPAFQPIPMPGCTGSCSDNNNTIVDAEQAACIQKENADA